MQNIYQFCQNRSDKNENITQKNCSWKNIMPKLITYTQAFIPKINGFFYDQRFHFQCVNHRQPN